MKLLFYRYGSFQQAVEISRKICRRVFELVIRAFFSVKRAYKGNV